MCPRRLHYELYMATACMTPPIQYGEISLTVAIFGMSIPNDTTKATDNTISKLAFRREITICTAKIYVGRGREDDKEVSHGYAPYR